MTAGSAAQERSNPRSGRCVPEKHSGSVEASSSMCYPSDADLHACASLPKACASKRLEKRPWSDLTELPAARFPASVGEMETAETVPACWPVSGLTGTRATFPEVTLQWHVHPSRSCMNTASPVVPLRGQRSFGSRPRTRPSCFPFNCEGKDTFTGTNALILSRSQRLRQAGRRPLGAHQVCANCRSRAVASRAPGFLGQSETSLEHDPLIGPERGRTCRRAIWRP
jgi:hypothetical protein